MVRKLVHILVAVFIFILIAVGVAMFKTDQENYSEVDQMIVDIPKTNLSLTSPAFAPNGLIPSQYTCDGDNISPPLNISGTPTGTQSFVLMVEDPDAPAKTWLHWLVYNFSPDTTEIRAGSLPPSARQGRTDFGKITYGGPCPPGDEHHYVFQLYALDVPFDFPEGLRVEAVKARMEGHILGRAELVGLYQRE